MMKQFFISVIVTCVFCLTVMSARADDARETHDLKVNAAQEKNLAADVSKQKVPLTLQAGAEKKMKAYPNPVDRGALLTIEIPTEKQEVTVFLYNTVGKMVRTFTLTDKKTEFNAPDVSGMYLLRFVENQKVIAVEKIVVKE